VGAKLATDMGVGLDAISAWQYPVIFGWAAPSFDPRADMGKLLAMTVEHTLGLARAADVRLLVREGNPARVLIDQSEHALMLIVGSRGHGGFAGLLLGSVSSAVAEHAACPVTVVHGDTDPLDAIPTPAPSHVTETDYLTHTACWSRSISSGFGPAPC
jgi:nucleotide-binding universal stress UspA family protein